MAEPAGESSLGRTAVLSYLAGVVMLTGVQLVSPGLPLLQDHYGLTDPQVGWITAVYVLPSVLWAIPSGRLGDRYGRGVVYSSSLLVYGAAAVLPLVFQESLTVFFVVRFVQGAAFGAIMPLTITLLGDVVRPAEQLRAQAKRNLSMAVGEGVFPVLGGFLGAALSWRYPFYVQLVAIPLGVVGWPFLRGVGARRRGRGRPSGLLSRQGIFSGVALAVQVAGFLRFLFKFGVVTYVPVLLSRLGATPSTIGLVIGATSFMTILAIIATGRLGLRFPAWALMGVSVVGSGLAYVVLALPVGPPWLVAALLVYGALDGVYGVVQNTILVRLVTSDVRATFVAVVGTVRNLGKLTAPVLMGGIAAVGGLPAAFAVVGAVAFLSAWTVLPLRSVRIDAEPQPSGRGVGPPPA